MELKISPGHMAKSLASASHHYEDIVNPSLVFGSPIEVKLDYRGQRCLKLEKRCLKLVKGVNNFKKGGNNLKEIPKMGNPSLIRSRRKPD